MPPIGASQGNTLSMADAAMAVDALDSVRSSCGEVMCQLRVTGEAVLLQDAPTARDHDDGLVEVLQRERLRVSIAGVGFREPLFEPVMGQVAIDTDSDRMVTSSLPGVELRLHDVAVGASLWI